MSEGDLTDLLALGLSRREAQVARLLVDDLPDKDIGRALGISFRTVRVYIARVVKKLGLGESDVVRRRAIRRMFDARDLGESSERAGMPSEH